LYEEAANPESAKDFVRYPNVVRTHSSARQQWIGGKVSTPLPPGLMLTVLTQSPLFPLALTSMPSNAAQ